MDPFKIIKGIASQASGSAVNVVLEKLVNCGTRKINSSQSLNENMDKLKRKREELSSRKEDLESKLEAEHQRGKRSKKEVELWLANVQKINDKIQCIENEVGEVTGSKGVSLGELVARMIPEVEELYHKGSFSDELVLDAPPCKGEIFPPTELAGETTAKRNMEEIWDNLMNDATRLIGVYGMGGSGKTTVMKEINNRLLEQRDEFDRVIWITVSKVFDIIKLQDRIAKEFNVDLSGCEDEAIRVARLFAVLSKMKRYVLIFDDVWEEFDLGIVGIPEPTVANKCKIVLTTRSHKICRNMRCKDIKMELLSKDEAWNLFLDIVGCAVSLTPSVEATMKLVAEECDCLPLAIITLAGSMKGVVDEFEWRTTLQDLREGTRGLHDMEKVLKQLEHSYFRLKDEKLQHCLLYCALYPEDFKIKREELINYLINEGIIEEKSRQAEFDKGQTILNKLENDCLLESCTYYNGEKCVKMHDLIRDMAVQIMGSRCMVQAGVQLIDLPDKEKWTQDIERVSLRNNNIREISCEVSPRCNKLSTLLLSQNKELRKIPSYFFLHMIGLRVLDLSDTGIENLPNSILDLENLTALLLRGCKDLKYVPSLARLRALRTLDLRHTGIEEVPHGLEMLVNLRCLDLNARLLKMFPIGILPRLSNLQCLIVWRGSETLKVKAKEVASLRKLEAFAGQFGDLHDLDTYVRSWQGSGAHRYLLQVGAGDLYFRFNKGIEDIGRAVILRNCSISRIGEDPLKLPSNIKDLAIMGCHDVISLCDVSSLKTDFLRACVIKNCDGIEYLISSSSPYCLPLQCLESLHLGELRSLRVLFKGEGAAPPPPGTFSRLEELNITGCPNIKKLFTSLLLPHLQSLGYIFVENCEGIEEIIGAKSEGEEEEVIGESSNHSVVNNDDTLITSTLPKLRILHLVNLPELKSIVYGRGVMVCDSLWQIKVDNCPKLKRLPLYLPVLDGNPSPPHSLRNITVNEGWWELLEWDQPDAKIVLQPLVRFNRRGQPIR